MELSFSVVVPKFYFSKCNQSAKCNQIPSPTCMCVTAQGVRGLSTALASQPVSKGVWALRPATVAGGGAPALVEAVDSVALQWSTIRCIWRRSRAVGGALQERVIDSIDSILSREPTIHHSIRKQATVIT